MQRESLRRPTLYPTELQARDVGLECPDGDSRDLGAWLGGFGLGGLVQPHVPLDYCRRYALAVGVV